MLHRLLWSWILHQPKADVSLRLQEVQNVVIASADQLYIFCASIAHCEAVTIGNQPVQPFQTPEENPLQLIQHFFNQKRIVLPVSRTLFCGEDQLPTIKTIRMIIQRSK